MKNLITLLSIIVFTGLWPATNALSMELEYQAPHLVSDRVDIQSYHVKLKIPKLNGKIYAEVKIELIAIKNIKRFGLHIDSKRLTIENVQGENIKYHALKNGPRGKHGLNGDVLKVYLKNYIRSGESLKFKISYQIIPNLNKKLRGLIYTPNFKGSEVLNVRSWPYYSRFWLPSNDHPGDVASFKYELHIPKGYLAVANGELKTGDHLRGEGVDIDGLKIYTYDQNSPIPTYATNIVVGNYEIYENKICYNSIGLDNRRIDCDVAEHIVPLYYFYPPKNNSKAFIKEIEKSADSLVYYSKLFKNYAFSALGFITAPHPFNMESVNLITLVDPDAAVHEVLHQWWGNTVYFRHWGDFWISEGLTSYFTGHYDEYLNGDNTSCHQSIGKLNHGPETDPLDIFDNTPYCKGSAAIAALRLKIAKLVNHKFGNTSEKMVFHFVMREFYNQFRFKKIGTNELVEYFRTNTLRLTGLLGYNLSQMTIDIEINSWKEKWFNL